jgi:hypothetical protein
VTSAERLSKDTLVSVLSGDVRKASERARNWQWPEQAKSFKRGEFLKVAEDATAAASWQEREQVDWLAAFGNDLAVDDDDKIESTPFDMSVARQRFPTDAVRLAESLAATWKGQTPEAAYEEALFGPWRYKDDQHSFGWDPTTIKLGAFTHKAPTVMANTGVRAAVWLAFESLPLFPCSISGGLLQTRAFRRDGRAFFFYWPVWESPISVAALELLLGLVPQATQEELLARGVVAVYRSERFKPNKYLASFRPPELVWASPRRHGG